MGSQTQTNLSICLQLLDHSYETPLTNMKMEHLRWPEKPLILQYYTWRSGTQYVAMTTKVIGLYFGAHLVEFYCEESKTSETYWLRYLSSSYLVKTWLSV